MLKRPLLGLSLMVALAACDQSTSVAPNSADGVLIPTLGTANSELKVDRMRVIRSNDAIFLSTVDEAQGLVVRHYDTEHIDFCGGNVPPPTAEAKLILTPKAAVYIWKTGVLPVYIYRLSEVPPQEVSPQFCADLVSKWIYRGTHVLHNHDNNLFFEPGRTNSFGFHGQGTVFDRAGKRYSYRERLHVVAVPDPFRILNESYTLTIK